jgi:hypothetical protein
MMMQYVSLSLVNHLSLSLSLARVITSVVFLTRPNTCPIPDTYTVLLLLFHALTAFFLHVLLIT